MPLVAWLYWIREPPWVSPSYSTGFKRCEITTCYQHRLIPDLPSVSIVTITFFFFFVYLSSLKFQRDEYDILCFFFWLNLNPCRHTICPGQRENEHRAAVCPPSKPKINIIQNHLFSHAVPHIYSCVVQWDGKLCFE